MTTRRFSVGLLLGFVLLLPTVQASAQKIEYPPEEFAARRQALCASLGDRGMVLMFGHQAFLDGLFAFVCLYILHRRFRSWMLRQA